MRVTKKTRICLLVDVRGWAFENIALKIKDRLKQQCDVDIIYIGDYQKTPGDLYLLVFNNAKPYDLVHFFWRGALGKLFGSHSVADAAATLNRSDAEQFLRNIATAIKTTWICDHLFLDSSMKSIWLRRALSYVDRYAVSSQILGNIYSDLDGCPSPDRVISDGVDLTMFTSARPDEIPSDGGILKIGWAGNSKWGPNGTDHKGLTSVIKPAIEKLKKAGYLIQGHFCDRQEHWTAREDMPDYYQSIDIYVCASLSEGTPNPILEAMACGLPILTTNVGIVSEAFGPMQQEFIVADRHSEEFLKKLRKLIENPRLRRQLSQENIDAIQCWDWRERITQWEHFFISTLGAERNQNIAEKHLTALRESMTLAGSSQLLAPRHLHLNSVSSKRVCLAMLVCNESATIKRCLDSVARFIDQYFIIDTGSTDNTVGIIRQAIGHLPGKLEHSEFTSFDDLRIQLYAGASIDTDFVFFIDADETLHAISSSLGDLDELEVGRIEVSTPTHSLVQPRLIRVATQLTCIGAYSETVIFPSQVKQRYLENVRIQHHCDGTRHTARRHLEDELQYLLDQLASNEHSDTFLKLARVYLKMNDTERAHEMLVRCCRMDTSDESSWHAHYLLGLLTETSKSKSSDAENHYATAFSLAPDRAEPLYRLIKIRLANNEFQTAQSLAQIAAEIEVPIHADYFERQLYEQEIPACLTQATNRLPGSGANTSRANAAPVGSIEESTNLIESDVSAKNGQLREFTSKPELKPKLTIGMATYDDYDGVYFSVMAISLYHPEVLDDIELIIIDNNPGGTCTNALSALCKTIPWARYIAVSETRGTAVRESVFAHARGPAVMCIDSHVMIFQNSLKRLIDYFDDHPESMNLYQGPLIRDDKTNAAYCMRESWNKGMLGVWESDPKILNPELAPFEIQIQGLGLFACRKDAWPKFNPRFSGFGGEEGYIHMKFRQRGGKVMCMPFLQWIHRFERPMGARYINVWEDRIRNYLIGHDELGQDTQALERHFVSHLGFTAMASARKNFDEERANAMYQFDAIFCVRHQAKSNTEQTINRQLNLLGISHRVQNIAICKETDRPETNRLITQKSIVQRAQMYGYQRIFIFLEHSLFHQCAQPILNSAITELLRQAWDICYFDIDFHDTNFTVVEGSAHLVRNDGDKEWLNHRKYGDVIAINNTGYSKFINDEEEFEPQAGNTESLATFAVTPKLATQIDFLTNDEHAIWYIDAGDT